MADGGHRKISKDKYFIAFIITFLIFFLGLSLGMVIDNARVQSLQYNNHHLDFSGNIFLEIY